MYNSAQMTQFRNSTDINFENFDSYDDGAASIDLRLAISRSEARGSVFKLDVNGINMWDHT